MAKLDAQSIINYIGSAKKKTPVKVYVKSALDQLNVPAGIKTFFSGNAGVLCGDWAEVEPVVKANAANI